MHYILDGHTPVLTDMITASQFFENTERRRVAFHQHEGITVSTVFLGTDHSFGHGPPLLFETMVFWSGHDLDEACWRYATWDEAETGHQHALDLVNAALNEQSLTSDE